MIPARRHLKSVLAGFLGTYTSRYSDFQGYWLFGFIVEVIDLMDLGGHPKPATDGHLKTGHQ